MLRNRPSMGSPPKAPGPGPPAEEEAGHGEGPLRAATPLALALVGHGHGQQRRCSAARTGLLPVLPLLLVEQGGGVACLEGGRLVQLGRRGHGVLGPRRGEVRRAVLAMTRRCAATMPTWGGAAQTVVVVAEEG